MPDRPESPPPRPTSPRPSAARDDRAERLAAQLRANLRRRKDQVRGRDALDAAHPPEKPRDED